MNLYKVNNEYFNTEQEAIEYSKSIIDNEYNNNIVSIIENLRKQIWKLETEIEDLKRRYATQFKRLNVDDICECKPKKMKVDIH